MKVLQECKCRKCSKLYGEAKSRADLKGYCSQACMMKKARQHGYGKNRGPTVYEVLKRANQLGSIFTCI